MFKEYNIDMKKLRDLKQTYFSQTPIPVYQSNWGIYNRKSQMCRSQKENRIVINEHFLFFLFTSNISEHYCLIQYIRHEQFMTV